MQIKAGTREHMQTQHVDMVHIFYVAPVLQISLNPPKYCRNRNLSCRAEKSVMPWLEKQFGSVCLPQQLVPVGFASGQILVLKTAELTTRSTPHHRLTHGDEMYIPSPFWIRFYWGRETITNVEALAGDFLNFCRNRTKNRLKTASRSACIVQTVLPYALLLLVCTADCKFHFYCVHISAAACSANTKQRSTHCS